MKISRLLRTGADDDRIKGGANVLDLNIHSDIGTHLKHDPFLFEQMDAPPNELFLQLHIGNAVCEQPARAVAAFKYRHPMSGSIQLVGGGQPAGPEPTTATRLPVLFTLVRDRTRTIHPS